MRHLIAFLISLLTTLPSPALSKGTVFVPKESGAAWEIRSLSFMPRDTSDEGIPISKINSWLQKNRGMKIENNLCYMNFLRDQDIVSPDRSTENEIRSDLKEYPNSFRQFYEPEPGTQFLVRVGIFSDCIDQKSNSDPLSFMAVLITDSSGEIKDFDALQWNFIRLFKRDDGKINALGCFSCGEVQELLWDKFNNRFYYNWIGH